MKIQLKRSNVLSSGAAKVPTAAQLEYGELAVNYNNSDPAIFMKDSNNNIIRISGVGNISDDGLTNVPDGTTPPANPEAGNLWYNSDQGRLYIYFEDADTSQWVDASPDSWDPSSYPDVANTSAQANTLDDRYAMVNGGNSFTGNVGIGTTPSRSLHVKGTSTVAQFSGTGGTSYIAIEDFDDSTLGFIGLDGGTLKFQTSGSNYSDKLVISPTGNIGIGTSSPQAHFTVSNNGAQGIEAGYSTGTTTNFIQAYNRSSSAFIQLDLIGNPLVFKSGSSSTEAMRIDSSGNLSFSKEASSNYPEQKLKWSNDSTTTNGFYISQDSSRNGRVWHEQGLDILFGTTNTEQMRIDSLGNVGIGTNTPTRVNADSRLLHLHNDATSGNAPAEIKFTSGVTGQGNNGGLITYYDRSLYIWNYESYPILFATSGNERMRIDSAGNIGIGNNDPGTLLQVADGSDNGAIRVGGNNVGTTGLTISYNNAGSTTTTILQNYRSTNSAAQLKLDAGFLTLHTGNSGTERMRIDASGNVGIGISPSDTNGFSRAVDITGPSGVALYMRTNAPANSTDYGYIGYFADKLYLYNKVGPLRFYANAAEAMHITSVGDVGIGTTTPFVTAWGTNAKQLHLEGSLYSVMHLSNTTYPGTWSVGAGGASRQFYGAYDVANTTHWFEIFPQSGLTQLQGVYNNTTSAAANVYVHPTGGLYRSTSSIKYKTDVETLENQYADAILNCRPVWYRSLCDADIVDKEKQKSDFGYYGFIAEEVADIDPRLVSWKTTKKVKASDGWEETVVNLDSSEFEPEGVNYSYFIPLMLNLIKRQSEDLELLKNKVAALEAG